MVVAQYPHLVGEQLGQVRGSSGRIPRLPLPMGEVVSSNEGVGVILPLYSHAVGEQLGERGGGAGRDEGVGSAAGGPVVLAGGVSVWRVVRWMS